MFNKKIFVFVAAAVFVAAPATAASFTGARAEVRGGWDRTTIKVSYDDGVDSFAVKGHDSGVNLGAEIAYDTAISPTVIAGAYGGVEWANTKECSEVYGNDRACLKLGRNLTAGIRFGAKLSPKAMFYAKAGYSNGQIKATYESSDDASLNGSEHANRGGFHIGIGAEAAVGSKAYLRLEYVRTEYSRYGYSDAEIDAHVDSHRDQILAGAGIRF